MQRIGGRLGELDRKGEIFYATLETSGIFILKNNESLLSPGNCW